jgi:hypothetical protein
MNRSHIVVAIALLGVGVPTATIVSRMESDGVDRVVAVEVVRVARSAAEREAAPGQPDLYKHRLGLFTTDAAQAGIVVADALCRDLIDAGLKAEAATCREGEAKTFDAGRFCRGGDVAGHYAEGVFRDRDRALLLGLAGGALEVGDPATVKADIERRGFKRCPEVP